MKAKQPNLPVFLIYAGIIHAIGLALLLPMLVTLPGSDGEIAPETSVIDVEIIPAPPRAAIMGPDSEQTSALPPAPQAAEQSAAVEPVEQAAPVAVVAPAAEPEGGGDDQASPPDEPGEPAAAPEKTKENAAKSAKPAPVAKKRVAARSRSAKPAIRRPARTQTKIAPFNGALSGLFSPGAAAKRR